MAFSVFVMAFVTFLCLFLFVLYEYDRSDDDEMQRRLRRRRVLMVDPPEGTSHSRKEEVKEEYLLSSSGTSCDIFSGRWVEDERYPIYGSQQSCPYLSPRFNCISNGRPDSLYSKWRWQPQHCTIPIFNAVEMLEIVRGKRIMFVGDSLSRNQWESMVCMLQSVIPDSQKTALLEYPLASFTALNYNASVEYFWAPYLVELDSGYVGNEIKRILRIDSIENNANYWRGVDILVFNSGHWWVHTGTLRSWDYIEMGGKLYQDMEPMFAYANGMATWANWIDFNINPLNTQLIFTSISPTHSTISGEGEGKEEQMCYEQTEPVEENDLNPIIPPPQMSVVESILAQMTVRVSYMNITRLSDYRRDAHPSIYTDLSTQQRSHPEEYADCSHWCVSGVPDIWNELLFSMLLQGF